MVNNDISRGDIISNCVVSDNTTDIIDNGNDSGNSNGSNVNNCKNDKNIVFDNASSSHGNNSKITSNIDFSTILVDNVPSNANDKIDKDNDNDNNGSITWDDVVAMEDTARELEEVPVPVSPLVIDPSMARTARCSDQLQQSYIPRRLTTLFLCLFVFLRFLLMVLEFGRSIYVLNDPEYISLLSSVWSDWRAAQSRFPTLAKWWDKGKSIMKGLTIRYCCVRPSQRSQHLSLIHI